MSTEEDGSHLAKEIGEPSSFIELADGGEVLIWERWIPERGAIDCFDALRQEIEWKQETISIAGRKCQQPRLSAWFGDEGAAYTYSGLSNIPKPWTPTLKRLRSRLETDLREPFNSVLCNLYRSEKDSMGWHSDKEKELGPEPTIASVSLGATRRFVLQQRKRKLRRIELELKPGSLLVMRKKTQEFWKHAVPKERFPVEPRINLTFRRVISFYRSGSA